MQQDDDDVLRILTPAWAEPLLAPAPYKGAKGGRSSGKSHFFAELIVESMVANTELQVVCIREIQKSLKFSAKKLIESKIRALGVAHLFDITLNEIRRIGGTGIIIFQGMQDHTADSIKSLEGFDIAWVEEAQSISKRSIELLIPTIRKDGSEIWFSWNPDQPDDPIEEFLLKKPPAGSVVVHVNYTDNPWCPAKMHELAEYQRQKDYEDYAHIWLGQHNTKSEAQIFKGRWRVDEFEPLPEWDGPYQGLDFGFSTDPTAFVRVWIAGRAPGAVKGGSLMIEHAPQRLGLDIDKTAAWIAQHVPDAAKHVTRADCARPETISYLRRTDMARVEPVKKWSGSVEDGIEFIKTFDDVVIHRRCTDMQEEARLYSYKIDKRTGDVTTDIMDAHNHGWDAVRYALGGMLKPGGQTGVFLKQRHR